MFFLSLFRKRRSRMFFLGILQIFYQSTLATALFFMVAYWGDGIKARGTSGLIKLVRKARSVLGLELKSLGTVAERRMKGKIKAKPG